MSKPTMLVIAPVSSQSGYGQHAKDVTRCLINIDLYDVKIWPIRWGNCPLNNLTPGVDDDIISRIIQNPNLPKQPELTFQITIPPEFQKIGKWDIGCTAGIETTICNPSWIEGLNRMDFNMVPSQHAKNVFIHSEFTKNDNNGRPIEHIKNQKPIEILFEGADTNIYKRTEDIHESVLNEFKEVKEDFCFLFVGHWLQGDLGHDRKDVGMLIKTFLETFKGMDNAPALVLKTSSATFSIMDRDEMLKRIKELRNLVGEHNKLPNIYLLHGQLSDPEMNSLYNHPKIKCMVSFTKGEGFGRPLLEFTMCGKPVISSGWSGMIDFLDKDLSVLLPGKLEPVHASAINDFIIKESQWFTVEYNIASNVLMEVYNHYNKYLSLSKKLMYQNKNTFSLYDMQRQLDFLLRKYVPEFPEEVQLKLPIKKVVFPKMKKIELSKKEDTNG